MTDEEIKQWNTFISEVITDYDEGGKSNVGGKDFVKLTKRWGKVYLDYLKASYKAKGDLSDEDFSKFNGNVPIIYINKYLK